MPLFPSSHFQSSRAQRRDKVWIRICYCSDMCENLTLQNITVNKSVCHDDRFPPKW